MRYYEDLDAQNGMNRAPRPSRDLTARSFENQLMGKEFKDKTSSIKTSKLLLKCKESKISVLNKFLISEFIIKNEHE
jgi:hypothetical protein